MSLTILHPIWGRDIGQYYGSYTFLAFKQELHSNIISATQRANFVPMNKGMHAIRVICQVGKEESESKITSMARDVSLQILRDALDMSWYKLTLTFLVEPEIIRGCIKLMGTVRPDGQSNASPFSYEYGYLCFRIATISFGLCLVEQLLDSAFKAAVLDLRSGRLHPSEVAAEVIADFVKRIVQSSPTIKDGHKMDERALIIPTRDVTKLLNLIWDDRNLFLRVVSHTYTPGMVGLMYIFWQLWRINRCRESSDGDQRLGVPLYEILRRYNLGVTSDQDVALSSLLFDTRFLRDAWIGHSELTDAKDSKALMHGYIHRISTSDTWHYKPHIFSIPPILEFVIRFAQPGAENVFPLLFSATTRFLWTETEGKQQIAENEIAGMISILHCFLKLFEILPDAAHSAMQNLIQDIVNSDLVGLIARLIVLRRPTMDKTDNERVRNHQFLTKVRTFFERIKAKIPPEILFAKPIENLDHYTRYRDYLIWCSEMLGPSEHNRRYCDASQEAWTVISDALGQDTRLFTQPSSLIECSYKRCSYSALMPGMWFRCSDCGNAYCSFRCQTLDRMYAHGREERKKRRAPNLTQ